MERVRARGAGHVRGGPGRAVAAAERVAANDKVLARVERAAGANKLLPPAAVGVTLPGSKAGKVGAG